MPSLHAVILAGGAGTRFWPASRQRRPKQLLPLLDGKPMLRATLDRLAGFCPPQQIWIATSRSLQSAVRRALPDLPAERILVEPAARDTAPCIALATAAIAAVDPEATMLVLPADHLVEPIDAFQRMLAHGVGLAQDDRTLVTFGVPPTYPATGYGYLECGETLPAPPPPGSLVQTARRVLRFREKPDLATAEQFVATQRHLWNSGIFVWTIAGIRRAMANTNPALAAATAAMLAAWQQGKRTALRRAFHQAPQTSIDYAVLEHAPDVAMVPAELRWDDLGSFGALCNIGQRDASDNYSLCSAGASVVPVDSSGNLVYAEGKRTVALFGVRDLVVVAVGDAVLVCPRERSADLKQVIQQLRQSGRNDLL